MQEKYKKAGFLTNIFRKPACLYFFAALNYISIIKGISTFWAELRRILHIFRFPAAFITAVLGDSRRLLRSALCTEFALVHRPAGTRPALLRDRLGRAAFLAELSSIPCHAAGTGPPIHHGGPGLIRRCLRFDILRSLPRLLPTLVKVLRIHASQRSCYSHAHKSHGRTCILILCRRLHCRRLRLRQVGRCHGRILHHCRPL